jgi:hypothetical protein
MTDVVYDINYTTVYLPARMLTLFSIVLVTTSEPLADLLFEEYDQTPSQPAPAHSSTQSKLRGARVQLPDDFLRV